MKILKVDKLKVGPHIVVTIAEHASDDASKHNLQIFLVKY